MKKFLSLMACFTLVLCGSFFFAACDKDEKKNPPATPVFTVSQDDIKSKANLVITELMDEVYNNAKLGENQDYESYGAIDTALTDVTLQQDYFVTVGTTENVSQVTSIEIGGFTYTKDQQIALSIGNNNFLKTKAFDFANNTVKVIAPILGFELRTASTTIKVNNMEKTLFTNTAAETLTFENAKFVNVDMGETDDGVITNAVDKVDDKYVLQLNSADDALLLSLGEGYTKNGKFIVRASENGQIEKFGITGVDEDGADKGLGIFFGRNSNNTVDGDINGKTKKYDVYYSEAGKSAATSVNFELHVTDLVVNKEAETKAIESVKALQSKVYNQVGENQQITTEQGIKDKVSSFTEGYYVELGTYLTNIEKIKVGDVEYNANEKFDLSVGKNSHIKLNAFEYDAANKTLKVAAPIIAFAAYNGETITIGEKTFDFATKTATDTLDFESVGFKPGQRNSAEPTQGKTNEYDVTLKTGSEYLVANASLTAGEGKFFLTRNRAVEGETKALKGFGITEVEEGGFATYYGYKENGVDTTLDGATRELDLCYFEADTVKTANLTFHFTVVEGNTELQEEINTAAQDASKTLTLQRDVELTARIDITSELTINLNGHTITVTKPGDDYNTVLVVGANGNVTVEDTNGNGKIVSNYINLFGVKDGGTLTINGGEFVTDGAQAVYVQKGNAVINGGSFRANNTEHRLTLNLADNVQDAKIVVKGGKFYSFDPSNSPSENPNVNFVAKGLEATQEGEWYVISQADEIEVANNAELIEAIENAKAGATITLTDGITLTQRIDFTKSLTINLNGNEVTATNLQGVSALFVVKAGTLTIKDSQNSGKITSTNSGYIFGVKDTTYTSESQTTNLIIEGGEFETNSASVLYVQQGKAEVKGGKFKTTYNDPQYEGKDFTLNCENNAYRAETAVITVSGGEFYNVDPSAINNDDKSGTEATNLVADGYTVIEGTEGFKRVVAVREVANETELKEAILAANAGDIIKFSGNITLTGNEAISIDKELTIDLNGNKLTESIVWNDDTTADSMFVIVDGGNLTFKDSSNGTGEVETDDLYVFWVQGTDKQSATLTIEGGKFTLGATAGGAYTTGGTILVKGGIFACERAKSTLNQNDNKHNESEIKVTGGEFKGYNPDASISENPVADYVPDTHKCTDDSSNHSGEAWYKVEPQD